MKYVIWNGKAKEGQTTNFQVVKEGICKIIDGIIMIITFGNVIGNFNYEFTIHYMSNERKVKYNELIEWLGIKREKNQIKHFETMISGILSIIDGAIEFLTFGFASGVFSFSYGVYLNKKY